MTERSRPAPSGDVPRETHRVIKGRRWRVSDPNLPAKVRQDLVNELMDARRCVKAALHAPDADAEQQARDRVHQAKIALGERGLKWWAIEDEPAERIEERIRALQNSLGQSVTLEDARLLAVGEAADWRS